AAPNPLCNFYRTKDGRYLHLIMLKPDRHWTAFCDAVGHPELREDPRFATALIRFQHCHDLIAILDARFAERMQSDWAETLERAGCFWGRVQSVEDVIDDAQAEATGAFDRTMLPDGGPLRIVKSPAQLTDTTSAVGGPPPELGQHTEAVLPDL